MPTKPGIRPLWGYRIFAHVFNQDDARTQGYHELSWNYLNRTSGTDGGRFDKDDGGSWGYYYAGWGPSALKVALAEVVANRIVENARGVTLRRAELEPLAVQFLAMNHPCPVLWIAKPADCHKVSVPTDISFDDDYDETRKWGRHWRLCLSKQIHGIAYASRRSAGKGVNVVLYSDMCSTPPFQPVGAPLAFRGAGRGLFTAACRSLGYTVVK